MKKIATLAFAVVIALSVCTVALAQNAAPQNLISLELRDTPVRTAIDSLFKGTGVNYAIEPGVTGTIPNLSLKDVTFDQALKTLTRSAGLSYRRDGDIYLISVKKALDTTEVTQPAPTPDTELAPAETDRKVEKIALQFADAQDISGIFGGSSYTSRSASMAFGGGSGGMGGSMGGGSFGGGGFGGGSSFGGGGFGGGSSFGSSGGFGGGFGGSGGRIGF